MKPWLFSKNPFAGTSKCPNHKWDVTPDWSHFVCTCCGLKVKRT